MEQKHGSVSTTESSWRFFFSFQIKLKAAYQTLRGMFQRPWAAAASLLDRMRQQSFVHRYYLD